MPVFNFNFPLTIRDNRWLLGAIVVVVATRSWTIYLNKWITIRLTAWSCKTNKSVAKPTRMWRQKFGGECDASFDNAFHKACSSQENLKPRRQRRGCSRPVAELKNGHSPHPAAAANDDKDLKMSWPEVVGWETRAGPTCRLACTVRSPICRRTTTPTASSSSSTPAAPSSGLRPVIG